MKSFDNMRVLMDVMNIPVFVKGSDGKYLGCNMAFETFYGMTQAEIVGKTVYDIAPKHIADINTAADARVFSGEEDPQIYEAQTKPVNREIRDVIFHKTLFMFGDGKPGIIGTITDVTDRRREEELHKTILHTITSGFWLVDLSGKILEINDAYCKMSGYSQEEFRGMHVSDVEALENKKAIEDRIQKLIKMGSDRFETQHKRKDGTVYDAEVSIHLFSKDKIVGFVHDITHRKQIESKLRQREKMDAIGQLAGGIAHDFNNQLATILGYAEMIAANPDKPDIKRYANNIQEAGKRSAILVKQLLAFSRKSETACSPINMEKLLREIADVAERTFDKRIQVALAVDIGAIINGDASQLHNAFLNLIINARDAMPEGGKLSITAEHLNRCTEIDSKDGCLKITIADTGIGMTEETKSKLFEPFFTTKGVGKGTGLGLASVYGTIMAHKGTIKVESEFGKGSKFIIVLPLKKSGTRITTTKREPIRAFAPQTIMVVDDEERIRDLLKDMLEGLGYTVVTYADPADALHYYRHDSERVALSLIDMTMPTMNGASLFAAMKNVDPNSKVLIVSGHSFNESIQSVINNGALGHIEKPFDIMALSKKVAAAITAGKPPPTSQGHISLGPTT